LYLGALWAYLDESGVGEKLTPASSGLAFSVGGFIALAEEWQVFSKQWVDILRSEGLGDSPEFHMTDFEAGHGKFRGWNRNRKDDVLSRLIDTIKVMPIMGCASVFDRRVTKMDGRADFTRFVLVKKYIAPAYMDCIFNLAGAAAGMLFTDDRVSFVCGRNEQMGALCDMFHSAKESPRFPMAHRLGSITFESPKDLPPLQASDLLAWEARRKWLNERQRRPPRRSLVRLSAPRRIVFYLRNEALLRPGFTEVLDDPDWPAQSAAMTRAKRRRDRAAAKRANIYQ
jgi:hypothetical protein